MLRERFGLTHRESEVLLWIAKGKANRDIGEILGLSARTVNKHLEQIYAKLGVENRASAAVRRLMCCARPEYIRSDRWTRKRMWHRPARRPHTPYSEAKPASLPSTDRKDRIMDNFVIVTGCSGGGKSTLLKALQDRGFATVEDLEDASSVISWRSAAGHCPGSI